MLFSAFIMFLVPVQVYSWNSSRASKSLNLDFLCIFLQRKHNCFVLETNQDFSLFAMSVWEEKLYAILCTSDVAQGHSQDLLLLFWSWNRLVVNRELAQRLEALSEATHILTQTRTHKHAQ